MASHEARRGRPKGSGLDDRSQLRLIAELIARDPTLKPTTAIKAIGVTDPSAIRRLREKLKAEPVQIRTDEPPAPVSAAAVASASASAASVSSVSLAAEGLPASSVPAAPVSPPRAPAPAAARAAESPASAPIPDSSASKPAPAAVSSETTDVFTQWCALGLSAASSTLEAQMALFADLLETPQVQCALRHQILLNEVAKALCPKRSDIRTFH